jgi:hypothetical protein
MIHRKREIFLIQKLTKKSILTEAENDHYIKFNGQGEVLMTPIQLAI